jgi:hypothetical protein
MASSLAVHGWWAICCSIDCVPRRAASTMAIEMSPAAYTAKAVLARPVPAPETVADE